eukprot:TRINITY_DN61133_c0_g1_i1.p1 TRINITY_DN61133_c0_g1~~TRINITY_DN61133_c0_g1_i1.p1  ORF type:complete len:326 (+),score=123.24 TRINITY_DN61133_c0_g1_i1:81-980(+)
MAQRHDAEQEFSVEVFIADTDCYQMVYHATYLKFFAQAREAFFGLERLARLQREQGVWLSERAVRHIRYFGSAKFGEQLSVDTRIVELGEQHCVFNHILRRKGEAQEKKLLRCVSEVGFTGKDGEALPLPFAALGLAPAEVPKNRESSVFGGAPQDLESWGCPPHRMVVPVYSGALLAQGGLCHAHIVDLFERSRSAMLGGPGILHTAQHQHKAIFVVARMDNVRFLADAAYGDQLEVHSVCELKSSDMCIVFHERLVRDHDVLAEAAVTVYCIDAENRQPRSCTDDIKEAVTKFVVTR